jgi:hypothetical protein
LADYARTFGAVATDVLQFPLDGFPGIEPMTFGALVRPTSFAQISTPVAVSNSTTISRGRRLRIATAATFSFYDQTYGGQQSVATLTANQWYYLIVEKDTGGLQKQSVYDFTAGTWTHAAPVTATSMMAANTAGYLLIGQSRPDGGGTAEGMIGQVALAWVDAQLFSNSQKETLVVAGTARKTALLALLGAADGHAWDLAVNSLAAQADLIGNADESFRSGTTVYTDVGNVPYLATDPAGFTDLATTTMKGRAELAGAGDIGTALAANPTTITFNTTQGTNAGPQAVNLTGPPNTVVTITEAIAWLSAPSTVTLNTSGVASVQLTPSLAALGAGTAGPSNVTFTPAGGSPVTVAVSYVIVAAPTPGTITVTPTTVPAFTSLQGTNPTTQNITVTGNPGTNIVIAESISWLTVVGGLSRQIPTNGTLSITLQATLNSLPAGTSSGSFTITPTGGSATTVNVSYIVNPPSPIVVSPTTIPRFEVAEGNDPAAATLVVTGTPGQVYTIAEAVSWLSIPGSATRTIPTSGVDFVSVTAQLSALAVGTATGSFTVTASGSNTVTVTVSYQIREVTAPPPVPEDPTEIFSTAALDRLYALVSPLWDE